MICLSPVSRSSYDDTSLGDNDDPAGSSFSRNYSRDFSDVTEIGDALKTRDCKYIEAPLSLGTARDRSVIWRDAKMAQSSILVKNWAKYET